MLGKEKDRQRKGVPGGSGASSEGRKRGHTAITADLRLPSRTPYGGG